MYADRRNLKDGKKSKGKRELKQNYLQLAHVN